VTTTPNFVRRTPVQGTPERADLDARYAEYKARRDALEADIAGAEKEVERRKPGSKVRDKARTRLSSARELLRLHNEKYADLCAEKFLASDEDLACSTTDEGQRLAVLEKLGYLKDAYPQMKAIGADLARKAGVPDEDVDFVAMDAANMVCSYPHFNTLASQVDISASILLTRRARCAAADVVNAMAYWPEWKRQEWMRRLDSVTKPADIDQVVADIRAVYETTRIRAETIADIILASIRPTGTTEDVMVYAIKEAGLYTDANFVRLVFKALVDDGRLVIRDKKAYLP
jgi:hypothetical protein